MENGGRAKEMLGRTFQVGFSERDQPAVRAKKQGQSGQDTNLCVDTSAIELAAAVEANVLGCVCSG